MWLLDVIKPNISLIVQHFEYKNQLFFVMKMKLGLMNWDLAIRFNLNKASVKNLSKMAKTFY